MIEEMFPGVTYREGERPSSEERSGITGGNEGGRWGAFFLYGPVIQALLEGVMRYWYDGENPNAFTEVISGISERTHQFQDDYDFWKLADTIRQSPKLLALIREFEGKAFFEELKNHEEGRAFLSQYQDFLEMNFYRGHADRDIYYARRIEDPNIDYEALRLMATPDDLESPEVREEKLVRRREAATAEVIENLSRQPLGDVKVEIFKFLQGYCLKIFMSRDDGRSIGDAMTFRKKLILGELGRRTVSRGLLAGEDDFYFLSIGELYELLEGKEPPALARAKVAARRKGFERFRTHEEDPPAFLKGDVPMELGSTGRRLRCPEGGRDQPGPGDRTGPGHLHPERHRPFGARRYPDLSRHGPGLDIGFQYRQGCGGAVRRYAGPLLLPLAGIWYAGSIPSERHEAHQGWLGYYGERRHR